ncbi:MAG: hypothetical protein V3V15_01875 [Sphingorhabdus sp.]
MTSHSNIEHGSKQVMSELEEVLNAREFVRSPVMSRLLTYLVEQSLSNPDNPPKAYHVAVEGLGRADDFDVQADSYPRVQVGRLRKMLAAYYAEIGIGQRICIPTGHYAVVFDHGQVGAAATENQNAAQSPFEGAGNRKQKNPWKQKLMPHLMAVAIVLVAAILLLPSLINGLAHDSKFAFFSTTDNFRKPPILYIGAVKYDADVEASKTAGAITTFLTDAFQRFHSIRVSSQNKVAVTKDGISNAYWLDSELVGAGRNWLVRLQLVALDRKEIVWSRQISILEGRHDLPAKLEPIVSKIASIYGVIPDDQRAQLGSRRLLGYSCVLQFEEYRRIRSPEMLEDVQKCIDATLEVAPLDPGILSAASFLEYLDNDVSRREGNAEKGTKLASKALIRGKNNAVANFGVARAAFFAGNCQRGVHYTRKALRLNPLEHDVLINAGAFLLACENPDGEKYLQRAITLDPDGLVTQYTTLVFLKISQGKGDEALALAESMVPPAGRAEPHYHLAMAMVYAENGQREKAKDAWKHLESQFGTSGVSDPEQILGAFITSKPLIKHGLQILRSKDVI